MRVFGIVAAITILAVSAGCTCGPCYYGPGMSPRQPYNACVQNTTLPPPVPLGKHRGKHKPSLVERRQMRDLRKWYRELNERPVNKYRHRSSVSYAPGYPMHRGEVVYDDWTMAQDYYDGYGYGGEFYGGPYIEGELMGDYGGEYYGEHFVDDGHGIASGESYCPDCQPQEWAPSQSWSEPQLIEPAGPEEVTTQPTPTPSRPVAPAPPESSTTSTSATEFYAPRPIPHTGKALQPTSIPPVEQILYAPPGQR